MIVTVFRSRVRPDLSPEVLANVGRRGARMLELASAMPGFVSYKDFAAEDGEAVSIVEFETEEQCRAWRDHPEHRETQAYGRDHVFSEYRIQVATVQRVTTFP